MPHRWNNHKELEGRHAVLSASKYSWIRYDLEKFEDTYRESVAATLGTRLHELAKEHILLGIPMEKTEKTLNKYINDCIGMRMKPEQVIAFNGLAFGTADAIRFDDKTNTLYVFDLKTGRHQAKFDQLLIYCVYFALEYGYRLGELNYVLRIYQNDEVREISYIDGEGDLEMEDLVNIHGRALDFTKMAYDINREANL